MRKLARILLGVVATGAFLQTGPATAQSWTPCTNAPSGEWLAVATSANGQTLVAALDNIAGPGVYVSTNAGADWNAANLPLREWGYAVVSADGQTLLAGVYGAKPSGPVAVEFHSSTDGGKTWARCGTNEFNAYEVSTSPDGQVILASLVQTLASFDFGNTWNLLQMPRVVWRGVACSTDGNKLVAAGSPSVIYTSANRGTNWIARPTPLTNWYAVASSADGSRLAAGMGSGGIYTSSDFGETWCSNNVPKDWWHSIASSADGSKLAAVGVHSIYTSADAGKTWNSNSVPAMTWTQIATSADGCRLVAVAASGQIYTAFWPPRLNAELSGGAIVLTWASTTSNFELEENSDFNANGWTTVTNVVENVNGQNRVVLCPSQERLCFRLKGS